MQNTATSCFDTLIKENEAEDKKMAEQKIYEQLYGDSNIEMAEREVKAVRVPGGVCGKILERGGMAWRCPVCIKDKTSMICQDCYEKSNHEGHNPILLRKINGGTCDCGDPESWDLKGSCTLHSKGFADELEITPDLLPEKMRICATETLESLMKTLNTLCLRIEELHLRLQQNPDHILLAQHLSSTTENVGVIVNVLIKICKGVSPIFLHMIAVRFRSYSINIHTTHKCHVRKFDTSSEEEQFKLLCINHHIDVNKCAKKSTDAHPCTCTMIENFMKIHFTLSIETRTAINTELFPALMTNKRLKHFMALAYFANYPYILRYASKFPYSLTSLSVQFIGYEAVVGTILNTKEYMNNILEERKRIIKEIKETLDEKRTASTTLNWQMCHSCYDLRYLIKAKYMTLLTPYIGEFVKLMADFHCIVINAEDLNSIPNRKEFLDEINEIEGLLEDQFVLLLSSSDLTNLTLVRPFSLSLLEAFEKVKSSQVYVEPVYHKILLHRCMSTLLTNYILTNYWLQPPNSNLLITRDNIKTMIMNLFAFDMVSYESFLMEWLKELLITIGYFVKAQANDSKECFHIALQNFSRTSVDFSLAIILLSGFDECGELVPWIIKSMHPESKDVAFIADALLTQTLTNETWKEAVTFRNRSVEKLRELIEHSIFTICCWASNDILFHHSLAQLRINLIKSHESVQKTIKKSNDYFQFAITKYIVHLYLTKKENEGLTNAMIQEAFADFAKDINKIESCLEEYANAFLDPNENVQKFMLNERALKFFDPFIYVTKTLSNKARPHGIALAKKTHSLQKFDYLLGEFTNGSRELELFPFKQLLRGTLTKGGTIDYMCCILKSYDQDFVTPWLARCCVKLILCCFPYFNVTSKKEEIKNLLVKSIGRLIADEGSNEFLLNEYKRVLRVFDKISPQTEEDKKLEAGKSANEDKLKAKQMKQKALEEFNKKVQAFKNKNSVVLNEMKTADPNQGDSVCSYCRMQVDPKQFDKEVYGKFLFIQKSRAYGYHLKKNLLEFESPERKEEQAFGNIGALTQGLVLTSCGHFIHQKCLNLILENPPDNHVSSIDSEDHVDYLLCPFCQTCANALIPPADLIMKGNAVAIKYVKDNVLPKMKAYETSRAIPSMKAVDFFVLISDYLTYELSLIDLHEAEGFAVKSEIILALVYSVRSLVQENMYDNLMSIKDNIEKSVKFLFKGRYKLFKSYTVSVLSKILIAAKLMETKETYESIYTELKEKLADIIRLAIMQIILRSVYQFLGTKANYDTINETLYDEETFAKLSKLSAIEGKLTPFLKKALCLKGLLFPIPTSTAEPGNNADILKAGWLGAKNSMVFYMKALDLKGDLSFIKKLESSKGKRASFLPLPKINRSWMQKCWKSWIKHVKKEEEKGVYEKVPNMLTVFEASCKPFTFVDMAQDYTEMQNRYASKKCRNCGKTESDSAVCLLCGELLCVGKSCCMKQGKGELTNHSVSCPGGCGMYLCFLNNKILLIDFGQICTYPSPYVNKYGESVDTQKSTGYGLLTLEGKIMEELKSMYVLHNIKQSIRTFSLRVPPKYKPYTI